MRQHSPACERNREPILAVLQRVLPARGTVLEIAAGTGQHAAYFSDRLPALTWQPTAPSAEALASIDAWREDSRGDQRPALRLDVRDPDWPVTRADAVYCANMIHIAPWEACEGLLRGAARALPEGGVLVLYGPFKRGGAHTAESNARFEEWLKAKDPAYGVRDLEAVIALAAAHGLALREVVEMPANNLAVVLARGSTRG